MLVATTGEFNVAIGRQSGCSLTSGSRNVFLGLNNGGSTTQGICNVSIGQNAFFLNTTGCNNVSMGANSLESNTTACNNTAIGHQSMSSNTTGHRNVSLGFQAGRNITTGCQNTMIGMCTGATVTTGVTNIVLGYLSDNSSSSVNGEYVIGGGVTGSGASTITIGSGLGKISNNFTVNATWTQSSDKRLKTNIQNDNLGLSFINRLNPVTYNWKPSNEIDKNLPYYKEVNERDVNKTMHGLIAQDVKSALDSEGVDSFSGWGTGIDGVQVISREMFISPLINAIKELKKEIDLLKKK